VAKVSVIIPTHNRSDLLVGAIKSALGQTYADLEVVVSDDKSTDNTREIVLSIADPRVKYVFNDGKKGPSATRNKGILAANGEYIAFLDDDDEWLPQKIEKQVALLSSGDPKLCVAYTNRLMINKSTGLTFSERPTAEVFSGNLLNQLMIKSPIHTSSVIVKKRCLDEVGMFDESMDYMEDRDMWIRLAMHWDFGYIEEPMVRAYYHGKSHLSLNLQKQIVGREIMLKRYFDFLKHHKKSWSALYLCLGAEYCQIKEMKKGRKNIIKSIFINPLHKMAYFHFLSSLCGPTYYRKFRELFKKNSLLSG
jgi:glycosyltransferase involved in cell wall biosynthesis